MDRTKEDVVTQQTTQLINDAKQLRTQDAEFWKRGSHAEPHDATIRKDVEMLASDDWKTFAAIKKNIETYDEDPANASLPKVQIEQGVRLDWYDRLNIGGRTTLRMDNWIAPAYSPLHVVLGNLADESWERIREQF